MPIQDTANRLKYVELSVNLDFSDDICEALESDCAKFPEKYNLEVLKKLIVWLAVDHLSPQEAVEFIHKEFEISPT